MASDQGDWHEWFSALGPALVLFARQFVGSHDLAEDAVQEGFARFWRHRHGVRDARAYLFSSVRTAAIDRQRRASTRRRYEAEVSPSEAMFHCPVEADERRRAVEAALAGLPDEQREVVAMKVWGGLTFGQIAEVQHVALATAASRYRYGLDKLRQTLSAELIT